MTERGFSTAFAYCNAVNSFAMGEAQSGTKKPEESLGTLFQMSLLYHI